MTALIYALAWFLTSASDADALRRTAPAYLDAPAARAHLAAARVAGAAHKLDPYLLLAIAYRESRYDPDAVTREKSGKLSCGLLMTTEPLGVPCPPPSIIGGYMAGAAHLDDWRRSTGSLHAGLLGYAGGYAMLRACGRGPVVRERGGIEVDLCSTPEVARAAWMRGVRDRSGRRSES